MNVYRLKDLRRGRERITHPTANIMTEIKKDIQYRNIRFPRLFLCNNLLNRCKEPLRLARAMIQMPLYLAFLSLRSIVDKY